MQAHEAAKLARRNKLGEAGRLLQDAKCLRHEALYLDPNQIDDAWARERGRFGGRDIHAELMAFYATKLSE